MPGQELENLGQLKNWGRSWKLGAGGQPSVHSNAEQQKITTMDKGQVGRVNSRILNKTKL